MKNNLFLMDSNMQNTLSDLLKYEVIYLSNVYQKESPPQIFQEFICTPMINLCLHVTICIDVQKSNIVKCFVMKFCRLLSR